MKIKYIYGLYFLVTTIHILAHCFSMEYLANTSKVFLIPVLIYYTYQTGLYFFIKKNLLLALLFSWIGDALLIQAGGHELFFMMGLASFLVAHLFYIAIFKIFFNKISLSKKKLGLVITIMVVYLISMLSYLHQFISPALMFYMICTYAVIITTMTALALLISKGLTRIAVGAILFILSDSIIALNRFANLDLDPVFAQVTIMFTYCLAQFFLVTGTIESARSKTTSRPNINSNSV